MLRKEESGKVPGKNHPQNLLQPADALDALSSYSGYKGLQGCSHTVLYKVLVLYNCQSHMEALSLGWMLAQS